VVTDLADPSKLWAQNERHFKLSEVIIRKGPFCQKIDKFLKVCVSYKTWLIGKRVQVRVRWRK
jgi:hypothetical protein